MTKCYFLGLQKNTDFPKLLESDEILKKEYDLFEDVLYEVCAELAFLVDEEISDKFAIIESFRDADQSAYREIEKQLEKVIDMALSFSNDGCVDIIFPQTYVNWLSSASQSDAYHSIANGLRAVENKISINIGDVIREYVEPNIIRDTAVKLLKGQISLFTIIYNGECILKPLVDRILTVAEEKLVHALGSMICDISLSDIGLKYLPFDSAECRYFIAKHLKAEESKAAIENLAKQGFVPALYDMALNDLGDIKYYKKAIEICRNIENRIKFLMEKALHIHSSTEISAVLEKIENISFPPGWDPWTRLDCTSGQKYLREAVEKGFGQAVALSEIISDFKAANSSQVQKMYEAKKCVTEHQKKVASEEEARKRQKQNEEREKKERRHIADVIRKVRQERQNYEAGSFPEWREFDFSIMEDLVQIARSGNAESLVELGWAILIGSRITTDREHGVDMIKRGIAGGCKRGYVALGRYYISEGEKYEEAIKCFLQAPDDDAERAIYLSRCYAQGKGVTKSLSKAVQIIENAKTIKEVNQLLEHVIYVQRQYYRCLLSIELDPFSVMSDIFQLETYYDSGFKNLRNNPKFDSLLKICCGTIKQYSGKLKEAEKWYNTSANELFSLFAYEKLRGIGVQCEKPDIWTQSRQLLWDDEGLPYLDKRKIHADLSEQAYAFSKSLCLGFEEEMAASRKSAAETEEIIKQKNEEEAAKPRKSAWSIFKEAFKSK